NGSAGVGEDLYRSLVDSLEELIRGAQKRDLPEALGYIQSAGYLTGITYDAAEVIQERTKEKVKTTLDVLFDLGLAKIKLI
ncbi:hypothetical protein OFC03_31305, partial [Escherichia coli]|nr:hypothetical protein [Escherichia coli]